MFPSSNARLPTRLTPASNLLESDGPPPVSPPIQRADLAYKTEPASKAPPSPDRPKQIRTSKTGLTSRVTPALDSFNQSQTVSLKEVKDVLRRASVSEASKDNDSFPKSSSMKSRTIMWFSRLWAVLDRSRADSNTDQSEKLAITDRQPRGRPIQTLKACVTGGRETLTHSIYVVTHWPIFHATQCLGAAKDLFCVIMESLKWVITLSAVGSCRANYLLSLRHWWLFYLPRGL